ncbi:unnamed protein product, partial [Mesorhabditis belari]|uniref:Uncharacterized protein n=1 Tax=Mesorhabditis belari TaxID=2138241 RepID=A0AAF3EU33_9BILA
MNIFVALWDYFRKSFGRKHINALALLFNAVCLAWICLTYYQEPNSNGGWVLRSCTIAITAMCSQLYSAKCMATNELYATAVRNLATANLSIWSRFGTMIAPQLFQLGDSTSPLPYIVLLVVTIIDLTAFQIFIPETKGKSLEKELPPKEKRIFYRERKRRQSLVTDDEAIVQ